MSRLQKIIREKYLNADEFIALAIEFKLEKTLNKAISQIELKINSRQISDLAKISGVILNDINSKMSEINDLKKKKKIEYFLADIMQDYLNVIAKTPESEAVFTEIQLSIKKVCEYSNYDYATLSKYLNLEERIILLPPGPKKQIYYSWNGKDEELNELAKDLHDRKIIFSVKDFKRMFKQVDAGLLVKCNKEKTENLVLLFQILKEMKLITPKGKNNSGHFAPLVQYAMDNDGKFLFEKSVNKIHEKMKRNKTKYENLKAQTIKHLSQIIKKN